jgi:hypothetical protein
VIRTCPRGAAVKPRVHFAIWHDKAGNAVHDTLAGVVDPVTGVTFPDLNSPPSGGEQ